MRSPVPPPVALAAACLAVALGLALPGAASGAARHCAEPVAGPHGWTRATPAEAGMDGAKLKDAMSYGTSQLGFALRVYRHGCLVAEDAFVALNKTAQFESWSMAKSITSLVFGRAMTLGLISPDDPVGALIPEADWSHGRITVRDLLTMTSGLRWNGLRDYDILMPDRVRDALLTPVARQPGTYWEYSQSGPALLAEAVQRAVGEDFQAFAQRELFSPLGITPGSWRWTRDQAGHTQGFYGVNMIPDDFARLGEVMRRGGVWGGRRLLSDRYVREAVTPVAASGCYGWLIWLNAGRPCVGVRVTERAVDDRRRFPDLPADAFFYSGLFGQLVTVFPTQGIVIVRNGQDAGTPAGGSGWEHELYRRVLGAVTDERVEPPPDAAAGPPVDSSDPDSGFQTSLTEPDQVLAPWTQSKLPPAGPWRARALQLAPGGSQASRRGVVRVRATCPARWPSAAAGAPARCRGTTTLRPRGGRAVRFDLAAGETATLRFRLPARERRALARRGTRAYTVRARVGDAAGGTPSALAVRVRQPRSSA